MHKGLLLILSGCIVSVSAIAQNKLWSDVQRESLQSYTERHQQALPSNYRFAKLNWSEAGQLQRQAPQERVAGKEKTSPVKFEVPLPDGGKFSAYFLESPVLSPELQQQYPSIKTYELVDPKTKSSTGRVTITPQGVTGLLYTKKGNVYINPVGKEYADVHVVYYLKDNKKAQATLCGVQTEITNNFREMRVTAGDGQLRTYRLAVAATGEYTAWAGSQANAIAYITATVNNISAIYERDLNVRFTLVTNNTIVFANAGADPYPTQAGIDGAYLSTNNTVLNTNIGSGLYDVGIVFNNDWNAGLAELSSICGATKGRAAAGLKFGFGSNPTAGPQGPFFEAMAAHEIGHQFGATHTHGATNGTCGGANSSPSSAWEPGGGSTIMAYTNVCTPNFFTQASDLYFHTGNILQMQTVNTGSGCPVVSLTGNTVPTASVSASAHTIPISTPFVLTANGSDADGNALTYEWEQMNPGTSASAPASTNTTGPNFRSREPSALNYRTFPRLQDIVSGIATPYEVLPSVGRTMNFEVTVRDNAAGGGATDEETVTVTTSAAAGPFVVTSQNTAATWTANGTNTATITWNVANTTAAPVSCSNVDILLSIDGGLTYPYMLAANTANDGTENITIPNLPTTIGRIQVRGVNNIFFNINTANITITSGCTAEGALVDPETEVTGHAGNAALNLSLNGLYGSPITVPLTGQLTTTDNQTYLAGNNTGPGNCKTYNANVFRYDTFRFTVNVAGNYTFARSGTSGYVIYNLYNGDFHPLDPCTNLLVSTFIDNPGSIINNYTIALTPGIYYTLVVGSFNENAGQPSLPASYTINVTRPAGGDLYTGVPTPGAGFNYAFVVVDDASGDIAGIDPAPGPDMSSSANFPPGTYTVYGISYSTSVTLATLNGYIGQLFTTLQNDVLFNPATLCSNLSKNSVAVNVLMTLPVQLLPLQAYKAGNAALLKWGTASEQNSSHFEILRSPDGVNFDLLPGRVEAQGNSVSTVNYSFTDVAPLTGMNYYRIRELDKDGRSVLSNIASINMEQPFKAMSVYPNPAKTFVTLEYYTDKNEDIKVQLIDGKGAVVRSWQLNLQPGRNVKSMNLNGLAKGMYALQTIGINGTMITRFVKE